MMLLNIIKSRHNPHIPHDGYPHIQFCCINHGCRFNHNEYCPVFQGKIHQLYPCGEGAICSEYLSKNHITAHN